MFGLSGPLLDACVLSILEGGDAYGYSLTQKVRQVMDVSESSLYPVLRRLEREGHLSTYNQAYQGRNRRYYSITPSGRQRCQEYRRDLESRLEIIQFGCLRPDGRASADALKEEL